MLEKSTFDFLRKLKKNNHKVWFDGHKAEYQEALKNFTLFTDELIGKISAFDPSVKNIDPKQCIFRIYNDVRFSKGKAPYKEHFGAFISAKGKNGPGPGYYVHIQPAGGFTGGGVYMPEAPVQQKIREAIATDASDLKKILKAVDFKKYYGGELWQEDALKTAPKGFPKDHPEVALLRLKHYTGSAKLTDAEMAEKNFADKLSKKLKALYPLNRWLASFVK